MSEKGAASDHQARTGTADRTPPLYRGGDETQLQPSPPEGTLVVNEGVNAGSAFESQAEQSDVPEPAATISGDRPGMAAVQNGSGGRMPGLPSDGGAAGPGPDGASADLFRSRRSPAAAESAADAGRAESAEGAPASDPEYPGVTGPPTQDAGSNE